MALRNFVERRFTKADIQEYIDTLEEKLKYYKIQIDDEDYYAGKYHKNQVNDKIIEEGIINIYKINSPQFNQKKKESTIAYDVKSISAILKLWGNKKARTYRQIKYVFVTTNTTLAYMTRKCLKEENTNHSYKIFPCITDVYLGTNIWLGSPVEKIEDFSQKKLLADCMTLIEPSDSLIQVLQAAIEKALADSTITQNQYHLLKQKAFTNNYVMNRTLGDETKFTDKITEELLQDIENEITNPYKEQIVFLNQSFEKATAEKNELSNQIDRRKQRDEENKRRKREINNILQEKARKRINYSINILCAGLFIPVTSFICAISSILPLSKTEKDITLLISAMVALTMGVLVTVIKTNMYNIKNKLEKWYYKKLKLKEYKRKLDNR